MNESSPHAPKSPKVLYCPSAPAEDVTAQVFGVIGGTVDAPRVDYLREPTPLTPELAELADGVHPEEIFRLTSRCAEARCRHFTGTSCHLGARLLVEHEPVSAALPPCSIRSHCRWFDERGAQACLRCPQVITRTHGGSPEAEGAAAPPLTAAPRGRRHLPLLKS